MLDFSVLEPYIPLLATAVWITLKFTFFSTIMGFFGGFILALITLSKNRVLSFGLNSAAYISEALRGGILAVDKGQWEGAMSLGVPKHRFLLDIILPQAIKNALPSLVNESIMLLKDSSLVSVIGVADTLRWADLIQAKTFRAFEAFIVAAAVYYVLVMALNFLGGLLEKKVRISD